NMQLSWGGARLYIPCKDRAARDAAIRAEFTGRNHDEVCRRHGISRRTLYRIIGSATS
ncbi:MAG: DNA-binding protein, partial [Spiribacter salinus]